MALFASSRKSAAFAAAVETVKTTVLGGGFEPDTLLTEPKLARMFGFARPHVRAAVEQLAAQGKVSVLPRRGFTVNGNAPDRTPELNMEGLEAVYGKRFLLEGHVVSKLAESGGRSGPDPFGKSIAWQEKLLSRNQIDRFHAYDLEFHATLFQAYGSDSLLNKFKSIANTLSAVWRDDGKDHRPAREILQEHMDICFWIRKGDAARAVNALYKHFAGSHQSTRSALGRKERPDGRAFCL